MKENQEVKEKPINQNKEENKYKHFISGISRLLMTFILFFLIFQVLLLLIGIPDRIFNTQEYLTECEQESEEVLEVINNSGLLDYKKTDLKLFGSENSENGFLKLIPNAKCELDYFYGQTDLNTEQAESKLKENNWKINKNTNLPLILFGEKKINDNIWTVEKAKEPNPNNTYSLKIYVKNSTYN